MEGELWSYVVNLEPIGSTTRFKGTAVKEDDPAHIAEISCELFSNKNGYFLYGQWTESATVFTFWGKAAKREEE